MSINLGDTWQVIKDVSSAIAVISCVVEFTPIKLHPISFILVKLGKAINKDVANSVSALNDRMDKFEVSLQQLDEENTDRYIKSLRGEILSFSNECKAGKKHYKHEFEHIIEIHEDYERLLHKLGKENGKVTIEFEYIKSLYKDCCMEHTFL